ncbi:hypothetical protein [Ralstonia sp. ASV6]|uniref:hypothetical protein n=1 Tax=Ralstonia sp. ASV6 TaxID=2795124 RepID=UPI0018EB48B5|nr:hypothetical protein [Ralstonia sp. ASV6]
MGTITVRLTALQINEIAHKLLIVADDTDLRESYELSEGEARTVAEHFRDAKPGEVSFDERYRAVVEGELEDRMRALHANWIDCCDEEEGATYRSLHRALKNVKDAPAMPA